MTLKSMALWVVFGVLFAIPFLPLFVVNDMFFPFITSKGFAFRILVEIGLGALVFLALADKKYRPQFSWTLVVYGVFVLWMFIADLFAVNPHKALWSNYERMDGWVTMIHAFGFFILASSVLSVEKLWKRWWGVVLGASALVSIYGMWQIFGFAEIHQGGVRVDASFGNAIYLAVYLMFTSLIAVWQAIESKGWMRYGLIALTVLQVIIIFFTATRGVILGLFGAVGFIALFFALSSGGKARTTAGTVLVALVLLAGGFFAMRDSSFVRSEPTLARLASVFDSGELKVRTTLWGMAYEGFLARPVTGWGQEGYNFVFNTYYKPSLYAQEPWFDRAHNTYLDWLIAGGAPALLLFLALLASAFLALFKSSASRPEKILLLGALVGYALQAVSAFDNLFSYILLAGVLAMAHEKSKRPIGYFERMPEVGRASLATVGAPALLVVTIAVVWVVNVPSIQASGTLIAAAQKAGEPETALTLYASALTSGSFARQEISEQILTYANILAGQQVVPLETRQKALTLALSAIQQEVARTPYDARTRILYAQGLRTAGDLAGYQQEIDTAISLSPKKQNLLFQRGVASWQSDDRASAAKDFMTAYELDTSYETAAEYAAIGRIITGDISGGKKLLMDTFGTTAIDDDLLRFAYFDAKLYDDLIASAKVRVENAPNDPQAELLLVQAYMLGGRTGDARALAQKVLTEHPEVREAAGPLLKELGL